MIALSDFLILGAIMFCLSMAGIFINRKNVIILLMSIELMLLSVKYKLRGILSFSRGSGRSSVCVFYPHSRGS